MKVRDMKFFHSITQKTFSLKQSFFFLWVTCFFAAVENIAFWRVVWQKMVFNSFNEILLLLSMIIFLFCATGVLFLLILWKPTIKIILPLLLLLSAAANYFSINYGVYIDKGMIENVFQTNQHEAFSLVTPKFILWFFLFGILPSILLFKIKIVRNHSFKRDIIIRFMLFVLLLFTLLATSLPLYKEYASFLRNNNKIAKFIVPTNYISGVYSYVKQTINKNKPLVLIGKDAKKLPSFEQKKKKTLLVVVLGETARAQNFSLNGYVKDTNPLLSQQKDLINFKNVSSCGTATAFSVPCMFSNMTAKDYDANLAQHQENVLDILNRGKVNVFWKENDSGCQGVCKRIKTEFLDNKNCPDGLCNDEKLLDNMDDYLAKQTEDTIVVLHTNGSHGPSYYQRYGKEYQKFTPSCNTNQIQDCTQQELTNVYDNTILHTDAVLNQTIELLKKHNDQFETAMLYLSDHGESLGENGIYLHGTPRSIAPKEQTHIPMMFWASNDFLQSRKISQQCMKQKGNNQNLSQDNFFHTLLGVFSIQTKEYIPQLDLLQNCQNG